MIDLSVVVAAYDMRREIPRTVRSLSPPYQTGIDPARVEIIVVDNGSPEPVEAAWFAGVAADVRVMRFPPGDPSPCRAINAGAAAARGSSIAVLIDGARLASPGLFERAFAAMRIAGDVFVATMGFHLGSEPQQVSLAKGYSRELEDRLLAQIGWPQDGYRLFEICARGESYHDGVLSPFSETVAFVMRRESFERIGGFHEGFRYGGGGLANFEFFERVHADDAITPVVLVGEGTFHQVHYGSTTRAGGVRARTTPGGPTIWDAMSTEFEDVVGRPPLSLELRKPLLFGRCENAAAQRCFFAEPEEVPKTAAARHAAEKRRLLAAIVAESAPGSVLDVGCGDLDVTHDLPVERYVGLDASSEAIGIAGRRRPDWRFEVGDLLAADLTPADLVLCLDVLVHEPDRNRYRAAVRRLAGLARRELVVAGYNQPPWLASPATFYHEPITTTLAASGLFDALTIVGGYRDTTVVRALRAASRVGLSNAPDALGKR